MCSASKDEILPTNTRKDAKVYKHQRVPILIFSAARLLDKGSETSLWFTKNVIAFFQNIESFRTTTSSPAGGDQGR